MPAESPASNPYAEDDLLVRADAAAVRSRESPANPYAAPDVHLSELVEQSLLPKPANADGLIDAWRDGNLLVVNAPGRLPEFCLQCGLTTPAMETLQLVPIKPQQEAGGWVSASLCPTCFRLHRRGEIDSVIGSCSMIVTPLLLALLSSLIGHSQFSLTPLVLFMLFPFAFVPSYLILSRGTQRIATLTEVAALRNNHWLHGAKTPFLDRLPLFPRK